jgi:hypothetical protein
MGDPELFPGVGAAVFAAQPFAVQQVSAGQFRTQPGPAEPVNRLPVQIFRGLALADQRAASSGATQVSRASARRQDTGQNDPAGSLNHRKQDPRGEPERGTALADYAGLCEAVTVGVVDGLGAVGDAGLGEDVVDVGFHG